MQLSGRLSFLAGFLMLSAVPLSAQVPHLITYQGRINSAGTSFNGDGAFKFALFNPTSGTFYWRNDGVIAPGEPATFVQVAVTNGLFTIILGDATIPGMAAIPPGVFNSPEVSLRIWFNDGVKGWAMLLPDQRITAVGYALMADTVRDGAITGAKLAPGSVDAGRLAPGAAYSNLVSSGSSPVPPTGMILSTDPNSTDLLRAGYVRLSRLEADSGEAWQELVVNGAPPTPRAGHYAVWTSTELLIWGGGAENPVSGGRYDPVANTWRPISTIGAPPALANGSAIWTGSEMIIWGGTATNGFPASIGARYNPTTDYWRPTSTNGAPFARDYHAAVWTGTEMIIWGGENQTTNLNTGARYNIASDSWTPVSTVSAPSARFRHTAVWTGSRMIVWGGGTDLFNNTNGGGIYNPAANTWIATPLANAPAGRQLHSAVWTGSEMIVWGGQNGSAPTGTFNSGGRFHVVSNIWISMSTNQFPRSDHRAVWTGSRMIVTGGSVQGPGDTLSYKFDPITDTWSAASAPPFPYALFLRRGHSATWTGTEMIVWGGIDGISSTDTGIRYNDAANTWTSTFRPDQPFPRAYHSAVWTGTELLIWGGYDGSSIYAGHRYHLGSNTWRAISAAGGPSLTFDHTAIWTGTEMIVWGGKTSPVGGGNPVNTGARFNPISSSWTPLPTAGAPSARSRHTAIWTGTNMIVWGGINGTTYPADGAIYNPASNVWSPLPASALTGRVGHSAVWASGYMTVWGGSNATAYLSTGARYQSESNLWLSVRTNNMPVERANHTAVTDGFEMIVWGGRNATNVLNNGARYNPRSDIWEGLSLTAVPFRRTLHSAVWTGKEMIVWGGESQFQFTYERTGGRYDPRTATWSATTLIDTPVAKAQHTAVWTGNEMLLWGGRTASAYSAALYSFQPPRPLYLYLRQ